jgi:hypothetical protein
MLMNIIILITMYHIIFMIQVIKFQIQIFFTVGRLFCDLLVIVMYFTNTCCYAEHHTPTLDGVVTDHIFGCHIIINDERQ